MANQGRRFVGFDTVHENSLAQVRGKPEFIGDNSVAENALKIHVVGSTIAAGKLIQLDLKKVLEHKGVVAVVDARTIPGTNRIGPLANDEPVFAEKNILYYGQPLFAVAAETSELARAAAKLANIKYETGKPVVTIAQAKKQNSRLSADLVIKRGRSAPAIKNAEHSFVGQLSIGSQDHFYLEGQIAIAVPKLIDQLHIYSSTQDVFHLQTSIIRAIKNKDVVVECMRVGGSFGGKQTQSVRWAIISALVAQITNRAAILKLDRYSDLIMTGKRHDFEVDYQVGFDEKGIIKGVEIILSSRCGCSEDLSVLVNDNAALHVDNAYYLKNITVTSKRYKTNTVSNTVFRGSGKPQGIVVIERIIDEIAAKLSLDPLMVRINNLYGESTGMITHYGMRIEDQSMLAIINQLKRSSTYLKRRKTIIEFNASSPIIKRGITLMPVKIGAKSGKLNSSVQAGAFISIDKSGLIQVTLSSIEMGQGLYTKVSQIVAEVFQVDLSQITVNHPNSDVFIQRPGTTACTSLELAGKAAQQAAEILKQRLIEFATKKYGQLENKIKFTPEGIKISRKTVQFKTMIAQACADDVRLTAHGSFSAEKNHLNVKKAKDHPFSYFINAACVTEIAVDSLSGESKVLRVDILQDCGHSINSAIDTGQIEGGFIQGMGWMLMEQLQWNSKGELLVHGPGDYKIPVSSDIPEQFNVRLLKHGKPSQHGIFESMAVGELPLVLAISIHSAINQAVNSVKNEQRKAFPKISIPATPERILMAIHDH